MSEDIDLESEGGRLKWARIRAGYDSATEFAKACGVNATTYRAYENNQNGYGKLAASFARKAHVPVEWLLEGGPRPSGDAPVKPALPTTINRAPDRAPTRDASSGEIVQIIQLDLSLPMGPGASVDEYVEEQPLDFDLAYIRSFTRTPPERLRLARGIGESMYPTLNNMDLVWIDSTQRHLNQSDRVWAVSINGAAAIKRLRPLKGGRVLVMSDNPAIGDYEVDHDELLIGGRVIRFARDL